MSNIIPEIAVSNMEKSMEFYNALGFAQQAVGIVDDNGSQWYSVAMGEANLWLIREDVAEGLDKGATRGNGLALYLSVDDVDAVYEKCRTAGLQMHIVKEIETLWYGLRQFSITDPDGYTLTINTPVDQQVGEGAENTGAQG